MNKVIMPRSRTESTVPQRCAGPSSAVHWNYSMTGEHMRYASSRSRRRRPVRAGRPPGRTGRRPGPTLRPTSARGPVRRGPRHRPVGHPRNAAGTAIRPRPDSCPGATFGACGPAGPAPCALAVPDRRRRGLRGGRVPRARRWASSARRTRATLPSGRCARARRSRARNIREPRGRLADTGTRNARAAGAIARSQVSLNGPVTAAAIGEAPPVPTVCPDGSTASSRWRDLEPDRPRVRHP